MRMTKRIIKFIRPSKKKVLIYFQIVALLLLFFNFSFNLNKNGNRIADVAGWTYNTSRNIRHYVSSVKNTLLIEPKPMCDSKVLLIIFVGSAPRNVDARNAIRATWKRLNYQPQFDMFHLRSEFSGKFLSPNRNASDLHDYHLVESETDISHTDLKFNVKVLFLMGRPDPTNSSNQILQQRIFSESLQFGDIIQEDFIDSYNNLTLKSIFKLKYVTVNCLDKVKYFMKCDDDSFINIPNLIHIGGTLPIYSSTKSLYDKFLIHNGKEQNRLQQNNILTGYMYSKTRPFSDVKSKYYSSSYMYHKEFYPDFLSGSGYLMSIDVAEKIFQTSLNTPLFHMEDVFITGIVADRAGVKRKGHPLFYSRYSNNPCSMRGMISQHRLTPPKKMYDMFEYVTNTAAYHCSEPWFFDFVPNLYYLILDIITYLRLN